MPTIEAADEKWKDLTSQPFETVRTDENGAKVEVEERIAAALEYIAAQLGLMNRKLDRLSGDMQEQERTRA